MGKACKLRSIQRGRRNISGVSGEEEGSPTISEEDEPMDDFWGKIRKGAMRTNGH